MRTDAAECELEGPRMMGPTTSLKILGGRFVAIWVTGGVAVAAVLPSDM
jgi:hypothetical protein